MSKGYIKIHRQLQECWIWDSEEKHNRRSAWIDLLMLANHKDKKIAFNDEIITIKRGQLLTSIRKLADRWRWSKSTVTSFLRLLENDNMILKDSNSSRTLLTIVNYEVYQVAETPSDTPIRTPSRTVGRTVAETNNNDKNVNNDKKNNIYSANFESFWDVYPRKKEKSKAYKCYQARLNDGFSEIELLEAAKKYAQECKKDHREEKYIKLASTFIGPSTPFTDYLRKEDLHGEQHNTTDYTEEELQERGFFDLV